MLVYRETYQEGAHFEVLIESVLMAPLDSRYIEVGFNFILWDLVSVQVCYLHYLNFVFRKKSTIFFIPRVILCFLMILESVEVKLTIDVFLQTHPCCLRMGFSTKGMGVVWSRMLGRGVGLKAPPPLSHQLLNLAPFVFNL